MRCWRLRRLSPRRSDGRLEACASPQPELPGEISLDTRDRRVVEQIGLTQFSEALDRKVELAPLHLGRSPLGGNGWLDPHLQALQVSGNTLGIALQKVVRELDGLPRHGDVGRSDRYRLAIGEHAFHSERYAVAAVLRIV